MFRGILIGALCALATLGAVTLAGATHRPGHQDTPGQDGSPAGDTLSGGAGNDRISGGAGGDNIVAFDAQEDTITCGPGVDVVRADAGDRISSDCERVFVTGRR